MNIFALCGFGVCAVCVTLVLKNGESRIAPLAAAAAGVVMLVYTVTNASPVFALVESIAAESGMSAYFSLILKSLGIAVVCQLASEICRDLGENAMSGRIGLAGQVAILLVSLPVIRRVFESLQELV